MFARTGLCVEACPWNSGSYALVAGRTWACPISSNSLSLTKETVLSCHFYWWGKYQQGGLSVLQKSVGQFRYPILPYEAVSPPLCSGLLSKLRLLCTPDRRLSSSLLLGKPLLVWYLIRFLCVAVWVAGMSLAAEFREHQGWGYTIGISQTSLY